MQREETDRMEQMERGHVAEVQPDCMTDAYTVWISETPIETIAMVFRVLQMEQDGYLTREEGVDILVNTIANSSRLLIETITGGKKIGGGLRLIRRKHETEKFPKK